jgi:hypothetical protein
MSVSASLAQDSRQGVCAERTTNKAANFWPGMQMFIHILALGGGPGGGKGAAMSALGPDANLGKFISSAANSNGAVIKAFFIF